MTDRQNAAMDLLTSIGQGIWDRTIELQQRAIPLTPRMLLPNGPRGWRFCRIEQDDRLYAPWIQQLTPYPRDRFITAVCNGQDRRKQPTYPHEEMPGDACVCGIHFLPKFDAFVGWTKSEVVTHVQPLGRVLYAHEWNGGQRVFRAEAVRVDAALVAPTVGPERIARLARQYPGLSITVGDFTQSSFDQVERSFQ